MAEVEYQADGATARVTINRPDRRNALSFEVFEGLRTAMRRAREDDAIRVVVLTGAGDRAFCAGADLGGISGDDPIAAHEGRGQFAELFRAGITNQQPIGLVHRLAKRAFTLNDEHFVLLGDPALVMQLPKAMISFGSGVEGLVQRITDAVSSSVGVRLRSGVSTDVGGPKPPRTSAAHAAAARPSRVSPPDLLSRARAALH